MKVILTGATGMLGFSLVRELKEKGWEVVPFSHLNNSAKVANIECIPVEVTDHNNVEETIFHNKPDIIIHAAALTNVDYAENNEDDTYKINTYATQNIANVCRKLKIPLVFISSGAVFDGKKKEPYVETDAPGPVNIYGKSKLLAEQEVSKLRKHLIVRCGWLIGGGRETGKKFVEKILHQIENGTKKLLAVNDVFGSPVLASDLSRTLAILIEKKANGTYHLANSGIASRYDIAEEILSIMKTPNIVLKPVKLGYFNEAAKRPKMEGLDCSLVYKDYGLKLPRWQSSLKTYIGNYYGQ